MTVAGYTLGRLLGRGGMSEVYAASHPMHGEVALKLLRVESDGAAFLAEAAQTRRIHHPNVVRIFDAGRDADGRCYVAMERIDGEDFATRLRARALTEDEAREVFAAIADGMHAVHTAGIVHRDLKPANVMLRGKTPLIVDFGIAKSLGAQSALATSRRIGTPAYMAPEQLTGGLIAPCVDVWALGVMMFEAVTGSLPFDDFAEGRAPQLFEIAPRALSRAAVSPALDHLIARCLERDPSKRARSMDAVARELRGEVDAETERVTQDAGALLPMPPAMSLSAAAAPGLALSRGSMNAAAPGLAPSSASVNPAAPEMAPSDAAVSPMSSSEATSAAPPDLARSSRVPNAPATPMSATASANVAATPIPPTPPSSMSLPMSASGGPTNAASTGRAWPWLAGAVGALAIVVAAFAFRGGSDATASANTAAGRGGDAAASANTASDRRTELGSEPFVGRRPDNTAVAPAETEPGSVRGAAAAAVVDARASDRRTTKGSEPLSRPAIGRANGSQHISLVVRSEPTGAQILVGGRSVGVTPKRLDLPGPAAIVVKRAGYRTANIRAERAGALDVKLVPLSRESLD